MLVSGGNPDRGAIYAFQGLRASRAESRSPYQRRVDYPGGYPRLGRIGERINQDAASQILAGILPSLCPGALRRSRGAAFAHSRVAARSAQSLWRFARQKHAAILSHRRCSILAKLDSATSDPRVALSSQRGHRAFECSRRRRPLGPDQRTIPDYNVQKAYRRR